MNRELKHFLYSQNSLNTFKSCPRKFKYKYIERINWQNTDIESRNYYESLKSGREFHLMCERYFNNIPVGEGQDLPIDFIRWMDRVKKLIPLDNSKIYLPEYEIMYRLGENYISAKYDLVTIDKDSIEIWDWKTETKKIEYKYVESRMQTIVYMALAREVIPKLYDIDEDKISLKMNYYQPKFYDEPVVVKYSDVRHNDNKKNIEMLIKDIKNTDYESEVYQNKNHCKYCEFNKLCNNKDVNYFSLEEVPWD